MTVIFMIRISVLVATAFLMRFIKKREELLPNALFYGYACFRPYSQH